MAAFKTRAELRLEELEALTRPLTEEEGIDLRKCLHAIYMRNWRSEREMHAAAMAEHKICPDIMAQAEIDKIAKRMESAFDPDWPIPTFPEDRWEEGARLGSDMLREAILSAQARAQEALAA